MSSIIERAQLAPTASLTLDIVDYPGEWLLDLPLLDKSYEQWSAESLALSREAPRAHLAADLARATRGLECRRPRPTSRRRRRIAQDCSPTICAPARDDVYAL